MVAEIRVAELFAGVGGFRLGLEGYRSQHHPEFNMPPAGPFKTVWANQWEPDGQESKQFAWKCYEQHFGEGSCVNEDVEKVLEQADTHKDIIPDFDMVVGGFPCQDYSVAKPLSLSSGMSGKKGVLWWSINKILEMKKPKYVLLENVDRLLKSPASQRGRDFAVMLSCFYRLGYSVEWHVINAADYGMPQRRRRVYIYAEHNVSPWKDFSSQLLSDGVIAQAFPIIPDEKQPSPITFDITDDPYEISEAFGIGDKVSKFQNAGVMQNGHVYTQKVTAAYSGDVQTLGDILVPAEQVPESFWINEDKLPSWQYLKGGKKEQRTTSTGYTYTYSEGPVAFPDSRDLPSRTILTGEGGAGASRTKHVVEQNGKLRRLVPDELDQLQMFPKGWTDTGMSDGRRAFCMGNALVTGIPHRIGIALTKHIAK